MKISHLDLGFPLVVVDDFYSKEQVRLIWEELDFLCYKDKLRDPNQIRGATSKGKIINKRSGIFLHHCYSDPVVSNILKVNQKVLKFKEDLFHKHESWFFKNYILDQGKTLISYYENSDYYSLHTDTFVVTVLTWFFKEPKRFTGGELGLYADNQLSTIKLLNNRMVAFPSCIKHQVSELKMQEEYLGKKLGRFCMTQFFGVASK